jgi:SPP1 family predicted phage head-tail adaptor
MDLRNLIGSLRHYITIQTPTLTSDGQGGNTTTWTDSYEEWAGVKFLSGSRVLDSGGVRYRRAVEMTLRENNLYDLTPANRIRWSGEHWTIHSVLPSEKLNMLKVLCYA